MQGLLVALTVIAQLLFWAAVVVFVVLIYRTAQRSSERRPKDTRRGYGPRPAAIDSYDSGTSAPTSSYDSCASPSFVSDGPQSAEDSGPCDASGNDASSDWSDSGSCDSDSGGGSSD